jgi:hypothetical protein
MSKLDRYFDAVATIRATGVSPDGWVSVTRDPGGEIGVHIRPGMLRRCPRDKVADEIRGALVAAVADHRRQYRQLRIDHFGTPLGVEPLQPADTAQRGRA